jgi:hypothetical protein
MNSPKRRIEPRPGSTRGNAFNDPRPGTKWHALLTEIGYRHGTKPGDLFGELVDFHQTDLADQYEAKGAQLQPAHLEHLAVMAAAETVAALEWLEDSKPRQRGSPGRADLLEIGVAYLCARERLAQGENATRSSTATAVARRLGLQPNTVARASRSGWIKLHGAFAKTETETDPWGELASLAVAQFLTLFIREATRLGLCNNSAS